MRPIGINCLIQTDRICTDFARIGRQLAARTRRAWGSVAGGPPRRGIDLRGLGTPTSATDIGPALQS